MQNRSGALGVDFLYHPLDDAFPLMIVTDFTRSDAPIKRLHVHNCTEIGFCQDGSGILIVGEKVLTYRAGDVTFINQSEVHFSRSAQGTRSEWSWIMFDPLRLVPQADPGVMDPWGCAGLDFANVLPGGANPVLQGAVARLIAEYRERRPRWQSAIRSLAWQIMVEVKRYGGGTGAAAERKSYDRLAPALQALGEDCGQRWTVGELARRCGMSEPNFRRIWTATLGQGPQSYVINLRMQMAAALLRSSRCSVLEVSLQVGFETLSSFNRLFRRQFGCTPSAWRAQGHHVAGGGLAAG